MSLNLKDEGNLIAIIQNKNGNGITSQKLYVTDNEERVRNGTNHFTCTKDEELQLVPNTKTERQCVYICGQSGSGKSYFITKYVKQYKKSYPKRNINVISSIEQDSSIDSLKPHRINVFIQIS